MRRLSLIAIAGVIGCVVIAALGVLILQMPTQRPPSAAIPPVSANSSAGSPVSPARSINSSNSELNGTTPTQAAEPKPDTAADQDARCRDRLASRGIYLQAGNPCLDIDAVVKKLEVGTYKFNKPETAYVAEPFSVVLTLVTAEGQDVSSAFTGTEGKVIEKQGRFAQHLEATLRGGPDFKVEPSGPQERTATSLSPVLWEWTITPLSGGTKTMVIEVAAKLILGADNERIQIRTLQEPIEVRVGVLHLLSATLSSAWGIALGVVSMIGAILGLIHHLSEIKRQRHRTK